MEEKKYTVVEVLEMTANILKGISIPVELSVTVGVPIAQSIGNIRKCAEVLAASAGNETKKDGANDGTESD